MEFLKIDICFKQSFGLVKCNPMQLYSEACRTSSQPHAVGLTWNLKGISVAWNLNSSLYKLFQDHIWKGKWKAFRYKLIAYYHIPYSSHRYSVHFIPYVYEYTLHTRMGSFIRYEGQSSTSNWQSLKLKLLSSKCTTKFTTCMQL